MGCFPMRSHRSGQITPSHTCGIEVVDFRFWNPDWMQGHDLHESGFVYQHLFDCSWNVWLTSLKEDEVSFFRNRPLCSLAHVHACTANASGCRSDIEFNMPWMVCVYASRSGLWLCILFYATEAGRHRSAPSVYSLTLMLPRCPPGVYTQGFDDIIGNIGGFNDRALFGLPGLK